jgi:putative addiction module component (TIGR02574 family)
LDRPVDFSNMSPDTKRLLDEAMRLPPAERAEFIARLIESLGGPGDPDADAAWAEEIERRCAAIDSRDAVTSDWESVRARIEREILRR